MKNLSDRTEMLIEDRAAFESFLSEEEISEEEFKQSWYEGYDGMIGDLLESCQEAFLNQLDRFIDNSDFCNYECSCSEGINESHMLSELRRAIAGKIVNM
jgi:hypothetical protein